MKLSQWYKILVVLALALVTGFQVYWLKDTYKREQQALTVKTDGLFNDMVRAMQDSALQARIPFRVMQDTNYNKSVKVNNFGRTTPPRTSKDIRIARVAAALQQQTKNLDSMPKSGHIMITLKTDSFAFNINDKVFLDSLSPDKIKKIFVRKNVTPSDSLTSFPSISITNLDTLRSVSVKRDTFIKLKSARKETAASLNATANWQPVTPDSAVRVVSHAQPYQFSFTLDSLFKDLLNDTIVEKSFSKILTQQNIPVQFSVSRKDSSEKPKGNRPPMFAGTAEQQMYKLQLGDNMGYLLNSIKLPILFSIFLVGVTVFSFLLLYRNWKKQKRLTDIKNEFISNITHELKTPIATVGVAMEALSNFNALNNPERAKEYIDISKQELNRLSLLVDKVLKLSMFENKEIELQYQQVYLQDVTQEVIASMRLQLEKRKAICNLQVQTNGLVKGDKMHLLSVVYNLLDNALKYSNNNPVIDILIKESDNHIQLSVTDNGIGIPPEYTNKVFEKFFRVPHGDTHTAKGYGLGLSYVWQVIHKHNGTIQVQSQQGQGTTFTITLPKYAS